MLFPILSKQPLNVDELVLVKLHEGKVIAGFVDKIDDTHFWLRSAKNPNDKNIFREKFSFKIDEVVRLN